MEIFEQLNQSEAIIQHAINTILFTYFDPIIGLEVIEMNNKNNEGSSEMVMQDTN